MINDVLVLQTERLNLGVLDESSAPQLADFCHRNREFFRPWEPIREDEYYSVSYQRQQVLDELKHIREGRLFKVYIFEKGDHTFETVLGSIALNNIVRGCFHSCHLGYKLDRDKTGRGYMTEGLRAVIDYAFCELSLHRIEANIMPRNSASLRVTEKLGFVSEGLARKYLKINGKWEDHIHMVLLNQCPE